MVIRRRLYDGHFRRPVDSHSWLIESFLTRFKRARKNEKEVHDVPRAFVAICSHTLKLIFQLAVKCNAVE